VDPTGLYAARAECGGPWPGPRNVYFERIDCPSSPALGTSLCMAMRGAARAHRDMQFWMAWEQNDPPVYKPAAQTRKSLHDRSQARFERWFGAGDGKVSVGQMGTIFLNLALFWEPFRNGTEIPVECESGPGACPPLANAYVAWYDSSLHLCPRWWNWSAKRRAAIVLHEMGHEYGMLDDKFYYGAWPESPGGGVTIPGLTTIQTNVFGSSTLVHNADTYEGMYFEFYVQ
jgi:hypothetical protein